MKQFLLQLFTWWNGQTLGTRFATWRFGTFVGEDEFGNRYFSASLRPHGERRWVAYSGVADPTTIPPGWYGWMHHTTDEAPTGELYRAHDWQMPHRPNLTGTSQAYRPQGSALGRTRKPAPDYDAWTPGG